jgi:hypothetical protein
MGASATLPKGSFHEPDDPEADGQTEYRGSNCKTDLVAHGSLLITDYGGYLNRLTANCSDGDHVFAVSAYVNADPPS